MRPRKTTPGLQMDEQSGVETELVYGVATEMWLELIAYPDPAVDKTSVRSLWLRVKGAWLRTDNPDYNVERAVLSAFSDCSERMRVHVWYRVYKPVSDHPLADTDPQDAEKTAYDTEIVGLVVHSAR
jgi:hypothetical protein